MPRKREAVRGLWEREPGSNIWWIRYRVDGVLKREKVGAWGAAKELLNKRKNEIREGIKMPENMRQASVRFKTLCDDILVYSKKHHRDFRSVEIRLKKVAAEFGERPADKIKPAEIDAWLSKVTKTPATSNRYRALFSLIFREALRNGKIASNPARLVRQRAENNGRIRFLTEAEEMSLRDAIRSRFPEHEAELTISLGTGMRLSEQYTLAWKNIDFERREINLDRTKNGSPRMIPMNDAVRGAMEEFARRSKSTSRDALVFPIKNPKDWFKPAMEDAKIVNYRWHDNRHTFCSRLAMRGENLKVIQQLAGHKTIQMSARYAHLRCCEWLVTRPDRRGWKMAGMEAVEVYWDAGQSLEPALIGTLHRQPSGKGEVLSFKYDGSWLDKTDRFTFDPTLTPDDRHQYPPAGSSNFGIFRNSSPDRWGRGLMQRWENLGALREGVHSRKLMEWDLLLGACDEIRLGALRLKVPGGS